MTDQNNPFSDAVPGEPVAPRAPMGRLIVISGPLSSCCHQLAWAIGRHLDQSMVIDGPVLAGMVASEHASAADELGTIRTLLLRYCAEIALAETYRRGGYDVVIVEDLPGHRLNDFRDLCTPDDIHLIILDGTVKNYPLGLHVMSRPDVEALAAGVLSRLGESLLKKAPAPYPSSGITDPAVEWQERGGPSPWD
ncbi:hypothetical protein SAMN05421595_1802 [Austwickia chelonae]|uniref:Uncharacterized protein n=1 Tax=Austwickia chelonae NBRC 105200 TaxID=1184607 RepID=K6VIV8_9MICO|nr:hypothetical protein [Austwickia chelonae]GAB76669.1 hypothetical protein AUCHE_02_00290 [Austwickia chelonae NBRC 105200]SEW29012.1 hypothetical protein SAMN05421595_1802 [Austwickia chelonae]